MPTTAAKSSYSFFEIRVPKTSETSPEAMAACFQALPRIKRSLWTKLFGEEESLVFEMVTWNQRIYFLAGAPSKFASFFTSQLTAQYPQALISPVADFVPFFFPKESSLNQQVEMAAFGQMVLEKPFYIPLKTYKDFTNIDPLSTVLGALAKADPADKILVQFLVNAPSKHWQNRGYHEAQRTFPTSDPTKFMPHPQKTLIEQKIAQVGFNVGIKILIANQDKLHSEALLNHLGGAFASMAHGEGNTLVLRTPTFWQKQGFLKSILERKPSYTPGTHILTATELATLYHLPNLQLATIKNIAWGGTLKGEPPENLPIAMTMSEEEKQEVNFFARTEFKNRDTVFGIRRIDRRKHVYIIGKTGTGKSTLIANMAINDMRNDEGLAVVDPHGDLCEIILDYIPKHRLNDVVYLDPNNLAAPFRMNPLEITIPEQAELVASGIVAIFHKLFAYSWGPRLEYILRNTIMTLTYIPNTTLLDVIKILTNAAYRNRVIERIPDETLKGFWINEFNKLDERSRVEAISPILNKVGQFTTSAKIRAILEHPHSSLNLDDIMNSGKIMLLNLSQGRIGEDNAALLGAMFITKMQLAAMNRVSIPEDQRRDFYLYVDEFQNFATSSFVKILSEARKYRLNLTVANQYSAQVEEDVQKAIFGNVGTIVSFLVGSSDARILNLEFGNIYEEADLVGLDNFEIITKLSINNRTSNPFPARTLPLPKAKNQNREKAIRLSAERYGKPLKNQPIIPSGFTEEEMRDQVSGSRFQVSENIQQDSQPSSHRTIQTSPPQASTPVNRSPLQVVPPPILQPIVTTTSTAPQPEPVQSPFPPVYGSPVNTVDPSTPPTAPDRRSLAENAIQRLTNLQASQQPTQSTPQTGTPPTGQTIVIPISLLSNQPAPKPQIQPQPMPAKAPETLQHQPSGKSHKRRNRKKNKQNRTQNNGGQQYPMAHQTNSEPKLNTQTPQPTNRPRYVVEEE